MFSIPFVLVVYVVLFQIYKDDMTIVKIKHTFSLLGCNDYLPKSKNSQFQTPSLSFEHFLASHIHLKVSRFLFSMGSNIYFSIRLLSFFLLKYLMLPFQFFHILEPHHSSFCFHYQKTLPYYKPELLKFQLFERIHLFSSPFAFPVHVVHFKKN